jgi:SNF2 family DNA or RNA helicase
MVEKALRCDPSRTIDSVRIDGNVQLKKRGHIVHQLHNDHNIRVILITIGCGAFGYIYKNNTRPCIEFTDQCFSLDLTAASRVHLLEPQWNPSLEDQAFARVHRLGQTRPVTSIRYVMEDSFEEVRTLWQICNG